MPIVKCEYCSKEVNHPPKQIKKAKHQFCSRDCYHKFCIGKFLNGHKWTDEKRTRYLNAFKKRDFNGERNPNWKGGKIEMADGRKALYLPGHPGAVLFGGTHILEYRLIAERLIGRSLRDDEIVHHKNGDITDNRLSNLSIISQAEHAKLHAIGRRNPITGRFLEKEEKSNGSRT